MKDEEIVDLLIDKGVRKVKINDYTNLNFLKNLILGGFEVVFPEVFQILYELGGDGKNDPHFGDGKGNGRGASYFMIFERGDGSGDAWSEEEYSDEYLYFVRYWGE